MTEEYYSVVEIRDGGIYIDGTPLKAYYRYELSHSVDEKHNETKLTLEMPVLVKGLNA